MKTAQATNRSKADKPLKADKRPRPTTRSVTSQTDKPAKTDKPLRKTAGGKRRGSLVVVESPAKARTIQKYLGSGFRVRASVGHVKDLPKSELGVDVENGFRPNYVVMRGKSKVMAEIKQLAREAERVYLAPDPDREGEAIAWHIAEELRPVNENIHRILLTEITKKGVQAAMEKPAELNRGKFEAQQARRVLDRLVGYQISPILWRKVRRGLSAGRVQSVAVRLLVEREREIGAFTAEEYWSVACRLETPAGAAFDANVVAVDARSRTAGTSRALAEGPRTRAWSPSSADRRFASARHHGPSRRRRATAPSPKRTMGPRALRRRLGAEGGGLSLCAPTRRAYQAVDAARRHIANTAPSTCPRSLWSTAARKARRTHGRSADVDGVRSSGALTARRVEGRPDEQEEVVRLYTLIWNRFVAC